MNENKLDSLLKDLGRKDVPNLPGNFRQNVWREIRLRGQEQAAGRWGWLDDLMASFLRPSPILASLAVALFVGMAGAAFVSRPAQPAMASSALSLDVFDPKAQQLTLYLKN